MLMHLFGIGTIISSILVIISKNPIIAIVNMIICFMNAVGIMIILEVDYIGLLYIIVYVGAIAILFIFVIMMLNIKSKESKETEKKKIIIKRTTPLAIIISTIYILIIRIVIKTNKEINIGINEYTLNIKNKTIIEKIGEIIYITNEGEWLIIISLILLIAMIGSIIISFNYVGKNT